MSRCKLKDWLEQDEPAPFCLYINHFYRRPPRGYFGRLDIGHLANETPEIARLVEKFRKVCEKHDKKKRAEKLL